MTTWLEHCRAFATRESIESRWLDCLKSFGSGQGFRPLQAGSFTALETALEQAWTRLPAQTEQALAGEVDGPQAALFVRRLRTVVSLLDHQAAQHPAGRLLRVGLLCRVVEILEGHAGLPRALRVRAAVDFFYSQAALLHHQSRVSTEQIRPWSRGLEGLHFTPVGDGVGFTRIGAQTPLGPQRIHLIRAERSSLRMEAVDRRVQASRGLSLAEEARQRASTIAISGGFFLYSEPDIEAPSQRGDPVGLLLNASRVLSPPIFNRACLAFTTDDSFRIQSQGLGGCRLRFLARSTPVLSANSAELMDQGVVAFSRAWGPTAPPGPQCSVVGQHVLQTSQQTPLAIPLNGFVLHFPGPSPTLPPVQEALRVELPDHRQDWISAMGAGPLLVVGGEATLELEAEDFCGTAPPQTFSGDETGDQNLLPRMAAGLDPSGTLFLAAVDGRDFHHALGLTLGALSELMVGLGCERAMNLDGGSSKRMVVAGEVMDRSSTEVQDGTEQNHQRPVRSALFFSPR